MEGRSKKLHLVTEKIPISEVHPTVGPVDELSKSQFLEIPAPRARIDPASYHEQLSCKGHVILDVHSAEDKQTCQLIVTDEVIGHRCDVRSDFCSAQIALEAILDGSTNVQRLRNKAAASGGILRNYTFKDSASAQDQMRIVEFHNRPSTAVSWDQCCRSKMGYQDPMCIPVFCTSDLPLEVGTSLHLSSHTKVSSSLGSRC